MGSSNVDFNKVANKNSIPKKAFIEAIKKAGNCNRLAVLIESHNGLIHKWLYKKCPKGKDLMNPQSAYRVQKAVKIKGLAERLCPSIIKIKNF